MTTHDLEAPEGPTKDKKKDVNKDATDIKKKNAKTVGVGVGVIVDGDVADSTKKQPSNNNNNGGNDADDDDASEDVSIIPGPSQAHLTRGEGVQRAPPNPGAIAVIGTGAANGGSRGWNVEDNGPTTEEEAVAATEHLVSAQLVEENVEQPPKPEAIEATEIKPEETGFWATVKKDRRVQYSMIGMVIAIIILAISLALTRDRGNGGTTTADDGVVIYNTTELIQNHLLPSLTPNSLKAITDEEQEGTTPQKLALDWLVSSHNETTTWLTPYRLLQRFAMATFYYSTDGDNSWYQTTNWLNPNVSECLWYSTWKGELSETMCNDDSEIYFIDFHDNRLTGELPDELGLMTALVGMNISENRLKGTIPTTITSLPNLKALKFYENGLSGPLPNIDSNSTTIDNIEFAFNSFTGTIPSHYSQLSDMFYFSLGNNPGITGTIPTEFGQWSKLEEIILEGTNLTGSMPDSICNLATKDTFFLVDCDKVECTCCTCFGANVDIFEQYVTPRLSNTTIDKVLEVGTPQQLAYEYLILGPSLEPYQAEPERLITRFALATHFWSTDGIDSWKTTKDWMEWSHECNWFSTKSYNNLPSCDDDMVYKRLMMDNNDLRGTIAEELALISNLEVIDLSVNIDLVGTIPTEFVALTNLKVFNVESCNLDGPLPEFDSTSLLEELSLSNNKLTGTIPIEYGYLTNLRRLVLDENEGLNGTIPVEAFAQLDNLETLRLEKTGVTGTISNELCTMPNLNTIGATCGGSYVNCDCCECFLAGTNS